MISVTVGINGGKYWFRDHQRHRLNGPAVIFPSGEARWFWRGRELSEYEHMFKSTN